MSTEAFATVVMWLIIAPIIAGGVIIFAPWAVPIIVGYGAVHLWHFSRLRATWPSSQLGFIAYSDSQLWAPYIERELLPHIADRCLVINRSRGNWKQQFRAESRALTFWGGFTHYNPIAVVLRPWWRIRVFRLYGPFREYKFGRAKPLEEMTHAIVRAFQEPSRAGT